MRYCEYVLKSIKLPDCVWRHILSRWIMSLERKKTRKLLKWFFFSFLFLFFRFFLCFSFAHKRKSPSIPLIELQCNLSFRSNSIENILGTASTVTNDLLRGKIWIFLTAFSLSICFTLAHLALTIEPPLDRERRDQQGETLPRSSGDNVGGNRLCVQGEIDLVIKYFITCYYVDGISL